EGPGAVAGFRASQQRLCWRGRNCLYKRLPPPAHRAAPRGPRAQPPDKTMTSPQRQPASRLEALLRARQFVITAEITPPVSCDADDLLRKAQPLAGLADAVNVPAAA